MADSAFDQWWDNPFGSEFNAFWEDPQNNPFPGFGQIFNEPPPALGQALDTAGGIVGNVIEGVGNFFGNMRENRQQNRPSSGGGGTGGNTGYSPRPGTFPSGVNPAGVPAGSHIPGMQAMTQQEQAAYNASRAGGRGAQSDPWGAIGYQPFKMGGGRMAQAYGGASSNQKPPPTANAGGALKMLQGFQGGGGFGGGLLGML